MKYIKLFEEIRESKKTSIRTVIDEYMKMLEYSSNEPWIYGLCGGRPVVPLEGWNEFRVNEYGISGAVYTGRQNEDIISIYCGPFHNIKDHISGEYNIYMTDYEGKDFGMTREKKIAHEFFGLDEIKFREKAIEITIECFYKTLALLVKRLIKEKFLKEPGDFERVIGPKWEWFIEVMNDENKLKETAKDKVQSLRVRNSVIRSKLF